MNQSLMQAEEYMDLITFKMIEPRSGREYGIVSIDSVANAWRLPNYKTCLTEAENDRKYGKYILRAIDNKSNRVQSRKTFNNMVVQREDCMFD